VVLWWVRIKAEAAMTDDAPRRVRRRADAAPSARNQRRGLTRIIGGFFLFLAPNVNRLV
jgi:hypothetical protein